MPSYKPSRDRAHYTAHVQEGRPFEVPAKSTLLMAALADGLDWPYGCRVGLCGRCRCKLLHGEVSQIGGEHAALENSGNAGGYILACRALLVSDILVLPPEHQSDAGNEVQASVETVEALTGEIALLRLRLDNPYRMAYQAGQYARISVPDLVPPRCFSFANACRGDGLLEFHIRLFAGGRLAEWIVEQAVSGAAMSVSSPLGDPAINGKDEPDGFVFIAGGTGAAPILAALEELAAFGEPPPVTFIYAARDQQHLYMKERLALLAASWPGTFRFEAILSREDPNSAWRGLRGHIFDHLANLLPSPNTRRAYLCGPPGLVDATELALLKAGWAPSAVTADRFLPAFD
ncbi:MAG: 2Fe-2S iron-sulfur cluster binding domain-containing protein [Pseudomonadota bacterium]